MKIKTHPDNNIISRWASAANKSNLGIKDFYSELCQLLPYIKRNKMAEIIGPYKGLQNREGKNIVRQSEVEERNKKQTKWNEYRSTTPPRRNQNQNHYNVDAHIN